MLRMEGLGLGSPLSPWKTGPTSVSASSRDMGGDSEPGKLWKEMLGLWDLAACVLRLPPDAN